ncbi:MAG: ExbD/TolR family protein [Planctomycetaceae bacterium]
MPETHSVDIDMTPMIDIVFQLITFFMVVINFDAADTDERVKMAISDLARPPKVKPEVELVLNIGYNRITDKEGQVIEKRGPFLFYAGEPIPASQLGSRFQPLLKREFDFDKVRKRVTAEGFSTTPVVIRADAECPAGVVQELIALCQRTGYEKFSLKAMQPENK